MRTENKHQKKTIIPNGEKYITSEGFSAIKNGIKNNGSDVGTKVLKPHWLRAKFPAGIGFSFVRQTVKNHKLSTVCEESMCPNIGECWNHGTATFMIMGSVCTRACRFCAVDTGNPNGWLDKKEPSNIAQAVKLMKLSYVVITSVDRDDLDDGGAKHFFDCIHSIKKENSSVGVEALTPDFGGVTSNIKIVLESGLDVFAQNIETVERLTHFVRDPRAGYQQTINVLTYAKQYKPNILTKTSLMLGLGETHSEIIQTMDDLRDANVDVLTIGQYLSPTKNHLKIERFVPPDEFENYRQEGLKRGFLEVVAGPLVRSSYRADKVLHKNNVGLGID